ncbi:MAG: MFS transporter [Puniceicoccales bacterium]
MSRLDRFFAPNFPFRPASFPFFYGWVIALAGTGGMICTLPGQTAGVGPFKVPLLAALGITSIQFSGAYLVGTVASGLTLPKIGGIFDRIGARKVATASAIGLALALFYLANCDRIAAKIPAPEGSPWPALIVLVPGFFAIRFFGQGILTMVCRAMIGKWFDRKRGLVSAISGLPVSIAFASAFYLLLQLIVALGGWREAWIAMGFFLATAGAFFCWLIFRDNPEECGLVMDGAPPPETENKETNAEFAIHREFTAQEALRTTAFWVFSLSICLCGFVGTAMGLHAQTIATEMGMTIESFSLLFPQSVIFNIGFSFLIGWMTARFRLKYAYFIMIGGQALANTSIFMLPSLHGQLLFMLAMGASWGAFGTLSTVTWPRYYGRKHLGNISGWVMLLMVVTSALGPFFFDLIATFTGNYSAAIWTCVGLCAVLFVCCLFTENPQRKVAPLNSE